MSEHAGLASHSILASNMTLRDWFAGQSIAGICPGAGLKDAEVSALAQWAYRMADAILAERNKNG